MACFALSPARKPFFTAGFFGFAGASLEMSKPSVDASRASSGATSWIMTFFFFCAAVSGIFMASPFSFSRSAARPRARARRLSGDAATPVASALGLTSLGGAFFISREPGGADWNETASRGKATGSSPALPPPPLYLELMCFQLLASVSTASFDSAATQRTASAETSRLNGDRGPSAATWSRTQGWKSTSMAWPLPTLSPAPATAQGRADPTTMGICRPDADDQPGFWDVTSTGSPAASLGGWSAGCAQQLIMSLPPLYLSAALMT